MAHCSRAIVFSYLPQRSKCRDIAQQVLGRGFLELRVGCSKKILKHVLQPCPLYMGAHELITVHSHRCRTLSCDRFVLPMDQSNARRLDLASIDYQELEGGFQATDSFEFFTGAIC